MGKRPGVKLNLTWCEDRVVPSGTDTGAGVDVPPPPPPPPPTTIGKIIYPPSGVLGGSGTTTVDA